jgi:predicted enzyme related to lactoylglutathione lyase
MFKDSEAFSSFSTDDINAAKEFYGGTLGLDTKIGEMGVLRISVPGGGTVMIYPKQDHKAATFTVLNFGVNDIDAAVDALKEKGIELERYDMGEFKADEKGIYRGKEQKMGPDIAWFTDPAGNILSVIAN